MTFIDGIVVVLLVVAHGFFIAAVAGLVRFPDLHSRLHALTKADNVGLGFLIVALMLKADTAAAIAKLGLIWFSVVSAGAIVSFLIAGAYPVANTSPRKIESPQGEEA